MSMHVAMQLQYGIKIFMITSFKDTCCIEILPKVLKSNNGGKIRKFYILNLFVD